MHFLKYTSVFSISIDYSLENDGSYLWLGYQYRQCDKIQRERKKEEKINSRSFVALIINGAFLLIALLLTAYQIPFALCVKIFTCAQTK